MFEGEYLKGKRNGKGKEYRNWTGKLKFDGEYLNDKRNGKGNEYNYRNLIFEGEYINDKRHGKGKEYYKNRKIKFEGEYVNGKSGMEKDRVRSQIWPSVAPAPAWPRI